MSAGTSSMAMRTGMRCASRTQVKTGLTLAKLMPEPSAFWSAMPRLMLSFFDPRP
jgi:hypothetical protein